MFYSPNVNTITKCSQTHENKNTWLAFTKIKPIYKLNINLTKILIFIKYKINPKLD